MLFASLVLGSSSPFYTNSLCSNYLPAPVPLHVDIAIALLAASLYPLRFHGSLKAGGAIVKKIPFCVK